MRPFFVNIGLALALICLIGCGGPQMARVKGRVTCNGKPVAQAHVAFDPVPSSEKDREPGKGSTGFTDDDGNYILSTYKNFDGAQVGKHRVTISLDDTNPARCARKKEIQLEVAISENVHNIELADK